MSIIVNNLGNNLLNILSSGTQQYAVSPFSIYAALVMIFEGSDGNTRAQILEALGPNINLQDLQNAVRICTFNMVNLIYYNSKYLVNALYLDAVKEIGSVSQVSFPCDVNKLNSIISMKTNGKFQNLINPSHVNEDTSMILINTIHLKAMWKSPFSCHSTHNANFTNQQGVTSYCRLMRGVSDGYYFENDFLQLFEKDYTNNMCMGFALPKNKLTLSDINLNMLLNFERKLVKATIFIPVFKQVAEIDLKQILSQLNIIDMFTNSANLSKICNDIKVTTMIHKIMVSVDEVGTEATATTTAILGGFGSSPIPQVTFKADHSFMWYIGDRNLNTVLFCGIYDGVTS